MVALCFWHLLEDGVIEIKSKCKNAREQREEEQMKESEKREETIKYDKEKKKNWETI